MRTIYVPGKLVLLGEYAVLDGTPAIVAAVDHGVQCTISPGDEILTPGDDRFVRAALVGAPKRRYEFQDWNPVIGISGKAGFGGSAAATVAACAAAGPEGADPFVVHQTVQGGGSGIDVFASLFGGVRRYVIGQRLPQEPLGAPVFSVVWSGVSAKTGPRVAQYLHWGGRAGFCKEMAALVEGFERQPVAAVRAGYALLGSMAASAGIAYDLPAFRRICDLAGEVGGGAKPSGAGGGDIAVAVFSDPEAKLAFERACSVEGLVVIPTEVVPPVEWTAGRTPS